jgi:hypothetical protein
VQFWRGDSEEGFEQREVPDGGIEGSNNLSNFEAFH